MGKGLFAVWMMFLGSMVQGQILGAAEITDPAAQRFQASHITQLQAVARSVQEHKFPYPFYFSRVLDIEQKQMERADQRGIRFDRFHGQLMLVMTGNYYASFATSVVDRNDRVRKVMEEVVTPLLQAAVPPLEKEEGFEGYALEFAYHVRDKVMGVQSEHAENVVFLFPRAAAQHFVAAKSEGQTQAAILDSQVYVDAEPYTLWVGKERPSDEEIAKIREARKSKSAAPEMAKAPAGAPSATVASSLIEPTQAPARIILPKTLSDLKLKYADRIASLQRGMGAEAHFVSYAAPEFIGFHQGIYLQLPLATRLDATLTGSRYKIAALAFDDHISHLVRPTLAYFHESTDFDGVVFSTSISQAGKDNASAVEFFLPFAAMKCYEQYDCSGQQLLDGGFVLINGERATLNLQLAESEREASKP
jgi:hypothetical protein